VTLVDSNIFMYAAGREHPHKKPATTFLEKVAEGSVEAMIDAEILQEILHRYRALGHWEDGRQVYDTRGCFFHRRWQSRMRSWTAPGCCWTNTRD
jgi:predicted nucleic acid-binding protein